MDIQDTVKGMPWTRRPASGVDRPMTDSVLQATAEAFAKARLR